MMDVIKKEVLPTSLTQLPVSLAQFPMVSASSPARTKSSPVRTSPPRRNSMALPDTVNPASRVVHYTPKAAIFDFYTEVKMVVEPNGHEVVIGKCGTCSQTIRGSRNVTSNFVTHVKRLHPEQQSNWERKKAERHGYFTKNYSAPSNLSSFSNLYSTFTIPTQVKMETTPTTMLCYDTHNMVTTQPIVTTQNTHPTSYTKNIVTQDNFLVTQDSTLTTTVKQEQNETSRKYSGTSPATMTTTATRVVSPDSVTDNEMWALLQAKQMLSFLVEQFLPLETADSPSLTTLLSRAPQKPYSSAVLQNVLVPTCVSHVTSSITCSLQTASSVSIVVTTQRKKGSLILFAVSLHFVDMSWKHDSHLLSVKYYTSVSQFERSFLDLLVKHNIQNKVFRILGTDMTNNTNFSLLNMPEQDSPLLEPVILPSTLAGITVDKCDPLPEVTNSLISAALSKSDLGSKLRTELKTSPQTFNLKYDPDMPKWSSEQSQISPKPDSILSETLSTLEPFKEIFELLKTDQLLVSVAIPSILSLIKLFDQKPRSELTSVLLEQLRNYLKKINCNPLFRAATFLDPRFKLVWCKDKDEELKVVSELRSFCALNLDGQEKENTEMKIKSEDCSLQPESKRIKLFTYFSSAETDEMDHFRTVSPLDREIKEYLHSPVAEETTNPFDYWKDNHGTFKQLSRVAGKLLTVPIVQTKVQCHLSKFEKRIESLEDISLAQTEEYLYLKVNKILW